MDMEIGEIYGKTFGIIGLGAIGRKVAAIAEAFGANVCYYSTSGNNYNADYKRVSLDELMKSSDIITIHAPLNENTKNLIGVEKLKLMKPSAILVNVARGGIVVEKDLAFAIDNKIIAGTATDVFSVEPVKADNPLLQVSSQDKVSFSPHCAWTSIEARTKLIEGIAQNIRRFLYK
jgi:glycerate dehydrogenase